MQVFHDAAIGGSALRRAVVTIGNFDGVHLGHRLLLERTRELASQCGAPSLAVTFRPHPAAVLSDEGAPPRLASEAQQRELFEAAGIDLLLVQRFDMEFARRSAESFHADFLRGTLDMAGIVVGSNFRFGAHRKGDVGLLRRLSAEDPVGHVPVEGIEPLELDGDLVSSSRLRTLIAAGDIVTAERLLGRPFTVEGSVVKGDGRGRQLGFPTANVEARDVMLPAPGVHACAVRRDAQLLPAVANVGRRPTFGAHGISLEVHVLDLADDLYGETVRVSFLARLRDERRFLGAEELVAQIRLDVQAARAACATRDLAALARVPGT